MVKLHGMIGSRVHAEPCKELYLVQESGVELNEN